MRGARCTNLARRISNGGLLPLTLNLWISLIFHNSTLYNIRYSHRIVQLSPQLPWASPGAASAIREKGLLSEVRGQVRTVRCLIGAVAVSSLAAVEPASAQQQLNYVGQNDVSVDVFYSNLPADTELFYVNEMTGVSSAAPVPRVGGSGTIALPMPPGPGSYSIMARVGGDRLARTIVFYSRGTASGASASGGGSTPSGSWSVKVTINGQVTNFSGGVIDGNVAYSTPPPPPTNYLLDDMEGYILDSAGAKLTTSP